VKTLSLKCSDIAKAIGAELVGDGDTIVTSIDSVNVAKHGSITFVTGKKFVDALRSSHATAVIMPKAFADESSATRLLMDDPYLGYARLTQFWTSQAETTSASVHPTAFIDSGATVADDVSVGPHAVIEAGADIASGVVIGAGAYIGTGVVVGAQSKVCVNATIHHDCVVGSGCEIHSGAVIGADGFGFAPGAEGWVKIHQLGSVRIGDRVSIGACTTIDRGALEDTIISDGVILDNHIQVAHNVSIGVNTAIAGCTGIAGSTVIGANCRIGGAVSIVGHISICEDVLITANSFVNKSVTEPGSYSSGFPLESSQQWRKNAVRLHRLDELSRQVGKLKS